MYLAQTINWLNNFPRDNMEKLYKHKILNVLGSDNKLAK